MTHVVVKNQLDVPYAGTLRVEWPDGWRVTPAEHPLQLEPGEVRQLPFTIESATDAAANAYPVTIRVEGDGGDVALYQFHNLDPRGLG